MSNPCDIINPANNLPETAHGAFNFLHLENIYIRAIMTFSNSRSTSYSPTKKDSKRLHPDDEIQALLCLPKSVISGIYAKV